MTEASDPGDARRPPQPQAPAHAIDPIAVARCYQLGEVRAPLSFATRGEMGRIWRLETATGSWAVKELLQPQTEDQAAADAAFQRAALDNGVSMPVPRWTREGQVLAEVPGSDGQNRSVRVYSWVELADGPQPAAAVQAADQLGRLHSRPFPDDQAVDPWFSAPVDDLRWAELVDAGRTARASWTDDLQAVTGELIEANRIVASAPQESAAVRCHLDYNPQNVLLDREGRPVVVDWENSGAATLDRELAGAIAEFVPEAEDVPAFVGAYLAAGGPRVPLTVSSFALALAVQGHLVEFYGRRSLDPAETAENRSRAAFWVRDICQQLFTVDRVERWVQAARPLLG